MLVLAATLAAIVPAIDAEMWMTVLGYTKDRSAERSTVFGKSNTLNRTTLGHHLYR